MTTGMIEVQLIKSVEVEYRERKPILHIRDVPYFPKMSSNKFKDVRTRDIRIPANADQYFAIVRINASEVQMLLDFGISVEILSILHKTIQQPKENEDKKSTFLNFLDQANNKLGIGRKFKENDKTAHFPNHISQSKEFHREQKTTGPRLTPEKKTNAFNDLPNEYNALAVKNPHQIIPSAPPASLFDDIAEENKAHFLKAAVTPDQIIPSAPPAILFFDVPEEHKAQFLMPAVTPDQITPSAPSLTPEPPRKYEKKIKAEKNNKPKLSHLFDKTIKKFGFGQKSKKNDKWSLSNHLSQSKGFDQNVLPKKQKPNDRPLTLEKKKNAFEAHYSLAALTPDQIIPSAPPATLFDDVPEEYRAHFYLAALTPDQIYPSAPPLTPEPPKETEKMIEPPTVQRVRETILPKPRVLDLSNIKQDCKRKYQMIPFPRFSKKMSSRDGTVDPDLTPNEKSKMKPASHFTGCQIPDRNIFPSQYLTPHGRAYDLSRKQNGPYAVFDEEMLSAVAPKPKPYVRVHEIGDIGSFGWKLII